ncbi:MAG: ABC transporter ATP-binding protein [Bacteroidales bacterium]|nr:ABC transporter ATP-binding protein [Bacteroidales bacterium]
MNEPILEIQNLSAGYQNEVVLKDVNLKVYEQDFLGIIGPNGGGKTTLVKTILGLLKPISGKIRFASPEIENYIGYMPQINNIDRKFPIMVHEVIESGLYFNKKLSKTEKEYLVNQVIYETGITGIAYKPIGELSGGQLQKALLARAMVGRPKLLILDEPSTYVDKPFESQFYEALEDLSLSTAVILISHDIGTVLSIVKNIACVNGTLHYHPGADVEYNWIKEHFDCPIDLVGHGDFPHRVLKKH